MTPRPRQKRESSCTLHDEMNWFTRKEKRLRERFPCLLLGKIDNRLSLKQSHSFILNFHVQYSKSLGNIINTTKIELARLTVRRERRGIFSIDCFLPTECVELQNGNGGDGYPNLPSSGNFRGRERNRRHSEKCRTRKGSASYLITSSQQKTIIWTVWSRKSPCWVWKGTAYGYLLPARKRSSLAESLLEDC